MGDMTYAEWAGSLSARRAWIEISKIVSPCFVEAVALRKESVDRNLERRFGDTSKFRRSPQGERG